MEVIELVGFGVLAGVVVVIFWWEWQWHRVVRVLGERVSPWTSR
jgi:hypothetical protein